MRHGQGRAEPGRAERPGDAPTSGLSRRNLLKGGLALGAGAAAASGLSAAAGASIENALAIDVTSNPTLSDIKHVVILMQENRSFDHYFGTHVERPRLLRPERRSPAVFRQAVGYQPGVGADATRAHGAVPPPDAVPHEERRLHERHHARVGRRSTSAGTTAPWTSSSTCTCAPTAIKNFAPTMGYFQRSDLPFYYALADAFTICDGYFCSVLGPTDPNRVMALSGTIDPAGTGGGPVLVTQTTGRAAASTASSPGRRCPRPLLDAGVSLEGLQRPDRASRSSTRCPTSRPTTTRRRRAGASSPPSALAQNFPAGFAADVAADTLPAGELDPRPHHPVRAPGHGAAMGREPRQDRPRHPHVEPRGVGLTRSSSSTTTRTAASSTTCRRPSPPAGHPRRVPDREPAALDRVGGIAGPVGLGFRVPCILMSPFTRGGFLASDTFDHTSTLRFIETRFGVTVPNLSAWRRGAVGDLTAALALGQAPVDAHAAPLPPAPLLKSRSTRRSSSTRCYGHLRRGHSLPAADLERHAHPGDHARPSGAAPTQEAAATDVRHRPAPAEPALVPPAPDPARHDRAPAGTRTPDLLRTPGRGGA